MELQFVACPDVGSVLFTRTSLCYIVGVKLLAGIIIDAPVSRHFRCPCVLFD